MKKGLEFLFSLFFIGLLTGCSNFSTGKSPSTGPQSVATTRESTRESTTSENPTWEVPTVFFHGYSGTKGSFGSMMTRLSKNYGAHLGEILQVSPQGEVSVLSGFGLDAPKTLIQVLFVDNQNNEWNQAQWIENTLGFLENQGFSKVNLVGHSMGGVSSLRYLLTFSPKANLTVEKFASIGAPFDNFEVLADGETIPDVLQAGPLNQDARYVEFKEKIGNFPKTIPWLNLAGLLVENDPNQGDGTVPLSSSLAMTAVAKAQGISYTNEIFTAQHSGLHENEKVDAALAKFLWP